MLDCFEEAKKALDHIRTQIAHFDTCFSTLQLATTQIDMDPTYETRNDLFSSLPELYFWPNILFPFFKMLLLTL
jgi:hypothetical protein